MRLTFRPIGWGTVGTLFLMAPLFAFTSERKTADTPIEPNWAHTEEATRVLKQVHKLSSQLSHDAELLKHYSLRDRLDASVQAVHLNQMRGHINTMGKKLMRLKEIHGTIAPWQQKARDRIAPQAGALAERAWEAIDYHAEEGNNFCVPAYTRSVDAMGDHAEQIKKSAGLFLDHAQNTERLEALERQLEYSGA